jgi:replicative DNA helicase
MSNVRPLRKNGGQRVSPQNLEAEESLLGAMLLSKDAIADAIEICKSADFYKRSHQYIFDALTSVFAKGDPADSVTIAEELKRKNQLEDVGGMAQLLKLQANTPSIGNAPSYATIVAEMAVLREMINVASSIAEEAYSLPDDVEAFVDRAESQVFMVGEHKQKDEDFNLDAGLDMMLDRFELLANNPGTLTGLPTGFSDLDSILGGLQASNLIILGARPGMGKTALAHGVASHVAIREKLPVMIFSLEMSKLEVTQRLVSGEALIDSTKMRDGKLEGNDHERLSHALSRMSGSPLIIWDNANMTIMDIRAKARRTKAKYGLSLIVVDYLQIMTGRERDENRQVEISIISRGLKLLAKELDVPVLALSQLSRSLESRMDKRPMLSDLRESGSLEQDADVVLFIYRDEVYNAESADKGVAEVLVAKHRSGPQGIARMAFIDKFAKFANLSNQ